MHVGVVSLLQSERVLMSEFGMQLAGLDTWMATDLS